MKARIEWKPEDLWIGTFWKVGYPTEQYSRSTGRIYFLRRIDVWICIVPMLPIHLWWFRGAVPGESRS